MPESVFRLAVGPDSTTAKCIVKCLDEIAAEASGAGPDD